jgi:hypothetical protein
MLHDSDASKLSAVVADFECAHSCLLTDKCSESSDTAAKFYRASAMLLSVVTSSSF